MTQTLVLDIGGTYIKSAILKDNQLIEKKSVETPKSYNEFITCLTEIAQGTAIDYDKVGISMPGVIDSQKGFAYHGGALQYIKNCEIRKVYQDIFKKSVTVKNDANSAILGEQYFGSLQQVSNAVMLVIGTGVGGSLLVNGQVMEGTHFSAGEFSLLQTNNEQSLSGLLAFQNSVHVLLKRYAAAINDNTQTVDGQLFFDQVEKNNSIAVSILKDYCTNLGKQIVNLGMILDPEVIVIGGGISKRDSFIQELQKAVEQNVKRLEEQTKLKLIVPNVKKSKLGNDANLFGASI